MNSNEEHMDEYEEVQASGPEPAETPGEQSCPVCERVIPSPVPEICPHCNAPIASITVLMDTADRSIDEALRDLRTGDLKSASKRLELVKTASSGHRLHVEIVRAMIERLSGEPVKALTRLNTVGEELSEADPDSRLERLFENVRSLCLKDVDALAACCEHYNFALFEARRGHYEAARKSLINALNEVAWHPDSHALMGKVLLGLNMPDDARYHFRRALASDPSNPTATRMLNEMNRSEKISFAKLSTSVLDWINRSPAWAGSILVVVILIAIAIAALVIQ